VYIFNIITKIIILTVCQYLLSSVALGGNNKTENLFLENEKTVDKKLRGGWSLWEPYQFYEFTHKGKILSGMDIRIAQALSRDVKIKIAYEEVPWSQHLDDIRDGKKDVALAATHTEDREKYAYFSTPYRLEEDSLFVRHNTNKDIRFNSITHLLERIKAQKFKLGVIEGSRYGNSQLNSFVDDSANNEVIFNFSNSVDALDALIENEIDGFIEDRMVGTSTISNHKVTRDIKEVSLGIKIPVHFMFSKKTVPIELVERFNQSIEEFSRSDKYEDIVRAYIYPVILLHTIDSEWFYVMGIIGTIAFSISGISIAARDNATLFGTLFFAMLPSMGGSVIRDLLASRQEIELFLTPIYMYYVILTTLIGFFTVKLLNYYRTKLNKTSNLNYFWDHLLLIGDSLGRASFVVTGVAVAVVEKLEPLMLWGAFFAFLTANGGGIVRDILRKKHYMVCIDKTINPEISIIWGIIFSIYLEINLHSIDPAHIESAVIFVVLGAFATRILTHYLKIPNLRFKDKKSS